MSEPQIIRNADSYNLDTRNTRKIINEIRASFGAPPTTMTDEQIEAGREVYGAKLDYDMAVIDEVQDTRECGECRYFNECPCGECLWGVCINTYSRDYSEYVSTGASACVYYWGLYE